MIPKSEIIGLQTLIGLLDYYLFHQMRLIASSQMPHRIKKYCGRTIFRTETRIGIAKYFSMVRREFSRRGQKIAEAGTATVKLE